VIPDCDSSILFLPSTFCAIKYRIFYGSTETSLIFIENNPKLIGMSDFVANDWWESSIFASSAGPFGFTSRSSLVNDNIWENVDGDIQTFIALEELLSGYRAQPWQHGRLD
jgi:hypothetical protein